jgi:hypothetical protein
MAAVHTGAFMLTGPRGGGAEEEAGGRSIAEEQ